MLKCIVNIVIWHKKFHPTMNTRKRNTHNERQQNKQEIQDRCHRTITILRDVKLTQSRHVRVSKWALDWSVRWFWNIERWIIFMNFIQHILILTNGIECFSKSNDSNNKDEQEVDHVPDDHENGFNKRWYWVH